MQNSINVSDFFKNDLTNYSCYSTLRMIASSIDGQKNSSRKVLYTVIAKNIKDEVKVSNFDGVVQSFSDYLHGSLVGVIQNMAANYVGSNVIPLLEGKGNFGTRFVNEPSAARYVFVKKPKNLIELQETINDALASKLNSKHFLYARSNKFNIISQEEIEWTLDGEYGGKYKTANIVDHERAIDFLRPNDKKQGD